MSPRIRWVEEDEAEGPVAELYAEMRQRMGRVPPIVKTFSGHPDALDAMLHLILVHFAPGGALTRAQREMIATYTASLQGCHYWTVDHAFFLRSQGAKYHEAAKALARGDVNGAGLSTPDQALLAYADKLTRDAAAVGDADLQQLRDHGFDDAQLWEATFVVAFFNFVTRMADAFGITPLPERETAVGLGRTDDLDSGP